MFYPAFACRPGCPEGAAPWPQTGRQGRRDRRAPPSAGDGAKPSSPSSRHHQRSTGAGGVGWVLAPRTLEHFPGHARHRRDWQRSPGPMARPRPPRIGQAAPPDPRQATDDNNRQTRTVEAGKSCLGTTTARLTNDASRGTATPRPQLVRSSPTATPTRTHSPSATRAKHSPRSLGAWALGEPRTHEPRSSERYVRGMAQTARTLSTGSSGVSISWKRAFGPGMPATRRRWSAASWR